MNSGNANVQAHITITTDAINAALRDLEDGCTCRWYALCVNDARHLVKHPILGAVPTCSRCVKLHNLEGNVIVL